MSLNNHECDHNKITGPVEITPGDLNYKDVGIPFTTSNVSIHLPASIDNNLEQDENGNIPLSSEILLTGKSDHFRLKFVSYHNVSNGSYAEIATGDDRNEYICVRQYGYIVDENGVYHPFAKIIRTLTLLDSSGNTSIPGNLTVEGSITVNGSLKVKGNIIKVASDGTETIL